MIPELGHFALILALLALPLVAGGTCRLARRRAARDRRRWMALARPGRARAQFVLVAIAFGCLAYAFVDDDFSVANVAQHSNSQLPLHYRFAATWGSHEGSLLLWTLMLAGLDAAPSRSSRRHLPHDAGARACSA